MIADESGAKAKGSQGNGDPAEQHYAWFECGFSRIFCVVCVHTVITPTPNFEIASIFIYPFIYVCVLINHH